MKIGIITNGLVVDDKFYEPKLQKYDFIVCADGGLRYAFNMGIVPDVILGDFDSTPPSLLENYKKMGCEIITYPTIKNETDTELALDYAIAKKPREIDILAGLGTRFDHSLANVHLLRKALEKGILARIITENNEVMVIDTCIRIMGEINEGVSLLPLTEVVTGVVTRGLGYPITDGILEIGKPYGISNYLSDTKADIKISSGLLLVMKYRD